MENFRPLFNHDESTGGTGAFPEETGGSPRFDADDDSVEDVRTELAEMENDLAEHNCITESEDESAKPLEELASSIRDALGSVGMFNVEDITAERLSRADPETLATLTPQTAEALYFDTARMQRKWFGVAPVRLSTLIRQARSYRRDRGMDLLQIQQEQRDRDLGYLRWANISSTQLLQLITGDEGKKQNINRLSFFLFDTQELREFCNELHEDDDSMAPWNIEETVIRAQAILLEKLKAYERNKDRQEEADFAGERWTFMHYQAYEFHRHRVLSAHEIGEMILAEMRNTTFDQFTAGLNPYEV